MIHSGLRVLYKENNSGWQVGVIARGNAEVNEQGIWIPVIPIKFATLEPDDIPYVQYTELHNLFTDSFTFDDWIKTQKEYFMTKEDYIKFISDENFDRQHENAFVSDGEYGYYPVSKFSKSWIEKQPFEYIIRGI